MIFNQADNIYLGGVPQDKVYLGAHLIWPNVVPPEPAPETGYCCTYTTTNGRKANVSGRYIKQHTYYNGVGYIKLSSAAYDSPLDFSQATNIQTIRFGYEYIDDYIPQQPRKYLLMPVLNIANSFANCTGLTDIFICDELFNYWDGDTGEEWANSTVFSGMPDNVVVHLLYFEDDCITPKMQFIDAKFDVISHYFAGKNILVENTLLPEGGEGSFYVDYVGSGAGDTFTVYAAEAETPRMGNWYKNGELIPGIPPGEYAEYTDTLTGHSTYNEWQYHPADYLDTVRFSATVSYIFDFIVKAASHDFAVSGDVTYDTIYLMPKDSLPYMTIGDHYSILSGPSPLQGTLNMSGTEWNNMTWQDFSTFIYRQPAGNAVIIIDATFYADLYSYCRGVFAYAQNKGYNIIYT